MNNYLLLVLLPNFAKLLNALGVCGLIMTIIYFIGYALIYGEAVTETEIKESRKFLNGVVMFFVLTIIIFFITCFIPTVEEMIKLGVVTIPNI